MAIESGIRQWATRGNIQVNGVGGSFTAEVDLGDKVIIGAEHRYRIMPGDGTDRWYVRALGPVAEGAA